MANPETIWQLKPHTAAKHSILRGYLGAWFPKLAWARRVIFIDGFAGPGEYSGGELGSPLIALEAAIQHKGDLSECELQFIFVERDGDRFQHLNNMLAKVGRPDNVRLHAVQGEFADKFSGILDNLDVAGRNMAPSLVMVDPFGFSGMPFALIRRAATQPRIEFLISFMYESIIRWRKHPDHEDTFDSLFGCREWRRADDCEDAEERKRFLLDLYVGQLRQAGLEHVRTFEMRDEGNRTEYFLVYATHSMDGLKAMKAAMWKVDPSGSFHFSDSTVSAQMTLFSPEPDYAQLKRLIQSRFAGETVPVKELEKFVVVETAFRETHYKKQILLPMEKAGEIEILDSPRKRPLAYPAGTVIRFL